MNRREHKWMYVAAAAAAAPPHSTSNVEHVSNGYKSNAIISYSRK